MSEPTVIPPGSGEVIGDSPERRVEILSEHDALHATWSRFAAGRDGADLHVHRRHTDLFYVLEGELTVRLGPEGEGVTVPAGVPHSVSLAGSEPARLLDVHTPSGGFGDFVRALREGLEGEVVAERVAFDQRAARST